MPDRAVVVETKAGVEAPFCPFCGARIAEWGHDDDCPRPKDVRLVQRKGTRRATFNF